MPWPASAPPPYTPGSHRKPAEQAASTVVLPQEGPNRAEVVWDEDRVALSRMYAQLWGLLFETELGPLPEWVHSPCCAEFMVSRERVRLRPLAFYASLLNWLGHTSQVPAW